MVEPLPVLLQPAFEPPRKLPEVVDKLPVQVLNAPLHLALVLRIRRMREMGLNAIPPTPLPPLLPELTAMIGQNRLRIPLLPLQQGSHLLGSRLVIELLSQHQKPVVVVDADEEPVFPALHRERALEVDLPELIGLLGPEESLALVLTLVPVQAVPREDVIYGFP